MAVVFLAAAVGIAAGASAQAGGGKTRDARSEASKPDAAANVPHFVVASVHPNRGDGLVMSVHFTPDGLSVVAFPLRDIVSVALVPEHGSEDDLLKGLPGWTGSERFDIEAKVSDEDVPRWKKLTLDEQKLALRALLVERLQLRWHLEPKLRQVYVLSAARGGARMVEADSRPHMFTSSHPGYLESHSTYMWQLTDTLERQLAFPVLDQTGLRGTYNYTLE